MGIQQGCLQSCVTLLFSLPAEPPCSSSAGKRPPPIPVQIRSCKPELLCQLGCLGSSKVTAGSQLFRSCRWKVPLGALYTLPGLVPCSRQDSPHPSTAFSRRRKRMLNPRSLRDASPAQSNVTFAWGSQDNGGASPHHAGSGPGGWSYGWRALTASLLNPPTQRSAKRGLRDPGRD